MTRKSKIIRELLIFATIYVLWSNYMSIKGVPAGVNSDALQPCLFYLPPIGIYALYFTVLRLAIFVIRYLMKRKRGAGGKV